MQIINSIKEYIVETFLFSAITGLVGCLFVWQQKQIASLNATQKDILSNYYTKAETDNMISLRLEPTVVLISTLQSDVTEMKIMLRTFIDGK